MRYEKLLSKNQKNYNSQTAASIFNAAYDLFQQKGYKSVTMRDIGTAANVNPALIPYYYTSKDKLGNAVYMRLADNAFEHFFSYPLPKEMRSAEKMYIYTIFATKYGEKYFPAFQHEFMEFCHDNHTPSQAITKLSEAVIQEYNLNISPTKNSIYLTALIGTERFLYIRHSNGEINIDNEEIADIIISNYFFNINLSDQIIADIISRCKDYLKTASYSL